MVTETWIGKIIWMDVNERYALRSNSSTNSMTFLLIRTRKKPTFHSALKKEVTMIITKKYDLINFGWLGPPARISKKTNNTGFNFNQESRHDWISTDAFHFFHSLSQWIEQAAANERKKDGERVSATLKLELVLAIILRLIQTDAIECLLKSGAHWNAFGKPSIQAHTDEGKLFGAWK